MSAQSQVSLIEQMAVVWRMATDGGFYDAADWIDKNFPWPSQGDAR